MERGPGSGGHLVSTLDEDEAWLDVIRESPFTSAAEATIISNFPGHVKTARRLSTAGIRNSILTQRRESLKAHSAAC